LAIAALIPLAFLAVFFAYPVVTLIGRGFRDDTGWTVGPILDVFASPRTWRIIRQTLTQAVTGTVLSVGLGVPGAYVLYRLRFPGQRALRALVAVPFVLPSVVVGVAFRSLLAEGGPLGFLGLEESFPAIALALVFFNYSVVVRTVGALWAGLDRRTADAARSLGAGPVRVFRTITLPALAPAIASAAALVFLFCASAFGVVLVLGGTRWGTVETEIWYQTTQLLDLPAAAALSIAQLVLVTATLAVANATRRRQERALRLTGRPAPQPLRAADTPALAVTGVAVLLLVLPLATLAVRSLRTAGGWGLQHYAALATAGHGTLTVSVWRAVGNSLVTALAAAGLALALGFMVSFVLARGGERRRGRAAEGTVSARAGDSPRSPARASRRRAGGQSPFVGFFDALFMLPLGISAVTVGFGFLITLNRPPLDLRTSWALIPLAQAMVALPLVVRTLLPTWRAIDPRLREAAATLGAAPGRVFATIDLPFLLRGLGLAAGFAFATSLGEFGATSFLARPDKPTLPVVVYRLISRPGVDNFGLAMAAAVVLALLTATVMAVAELLGPKGATGW
jgi:thiamine transport system permease protein